MSLLLIKALTSPIYDAGRLRSYVYNWFILYMTIGWYEIVLNDLPPQSTLLDVGIGTAGALVACSTILREKQLKVVGIDYDDHYTRQAALAIREAQLEDHVVQVVTMDFYKLLEDRDKLLSSHQTFDAIYFSGSFSLLPDWTTALDTAASLLAPTGGRIYITQTYQKQTSRLLQWLKPWMRYFTTIDFGKLVTNRTMEEFYANHLNDQNNNGGGNNWKMTRHEKIPGNVDNPWQAAYWTCLEVFGGAGIGSLGN